MTEIITALQDNPFYVSEPEQTEPAQESEGVSAPEIPETQTEPATEPETSTTEPVEGKPVLSEFEIEGIGKVTVDEIKEWRNSGLRQSDYTKKTQEIARQKEEYAVAIELYEYLQQNPQLVEVLKQADTTPQGKQIATQATPEMQMIRQLAMNQLSDKLDRDIADIKLKYNDPHLDETELYNTALQLGVQDLEFVYRAMRFNQIQNVDPDELKQQAKKELEEELKKNKQITQTIVKPTTNPAPARQMLTEQEKRVAAGMGLSEEDYLKWR